VAVPTGTRHVIILVIIIILAVKYSIIEKGSNEQYFKNIPICIRHDTHFLVWNDEI